MNGTDRLPPPRPTGDGPAAGTDGRAPGRGRPRVAVVGDVLLDRELEGRVDRLCPDAPVPVVDVERVLDGPGGAGLAALLCAEQAEVVLLAPLADDDGGRVLRTSFERAGVRVQPWRHQGRTRCKTRVRAAGQPLLRLDEGGPGRPLDVAAGPLRETLAAADVVLVSDYGAGVSADPVVREALATAATERPVVWDPHPRGAPPVPGCALVTPNLSEARRWSGQDGRPDEVAVLLRARWQAGGVCVTTGAEGAWLATGDAGPVAAPAPRAADGDPCGAGDRFAATAACALAAGAPPAEAVARAVTAATAWVAAGGAAAFRRRGTTEDASRHPAPLPHPEPAHSQHPEPSHSQRPEPVEGPPPAPPHEHAPLSTGDPDDLAARVRVAGGTLVATGGCFDVLHAGHVGCLEAARELGDALVVLLNSDDSVRRLKGAGRPVQPAADRARVLAGLTSVDAVVVFDEDDPGAALDRLRPDVWVKGGDYRGSALPEAELVRGWGGRVELLPHLAGRSSTAILSRSARPAGPGPTEAPSTGVPPTRSSPSESPPPGSPPTRSPPPGSPPSGSPSSGARPAAPPAHDRPNRRPVEAR